MKMKHRTFLLLLLPQLLTSAPSIIPHGYSVETIDPPKDSKGREIQFGIGGIDFDENGKAYIAARVAGVWTLDSSGNWQQFADGLHDPQGIRVLPDGKGVYVSQKPEITLLRDTDNDGAADVYENFCDQWTFAGNYCEYVHGLPTDAKGNMYINLNLADGGGGDNTPHLTNKVGAMSMGTTGGYDGWMMKILPDGEAIPWAFGLRSPAGLGINRKDEIFYTDNQGGWVPTSPLYHVRPGGFYGYISSMIDLPAFKEGKRNLKDVSRDELVKRSRKPVVWMPQSELMNSPSNAEFDYTEGKFGPFKGQIFIGCQARSNIVRVDMQKVRGEYQGAVFNFVDHLQSGCMRLKFDSTGRLWIGQTGRGWASRGNKLYGLQRVVWDGEMMPFEMQSMKLTHEGFKVTFTKPVDEKTALSTESYEFNNWHYHYHVQYGSPKVDLKNLPFKVSRLSKDKKTVWFDLPLTTDKVYHLICKGLKAEDGSMMSNSHAYYTLNWLLDEPKEAEKNLIAGAVADIELTGLKGKRILMYTGTDKERSSALAYVEEAMRQISRKNEFELTISDDPVALDQPALGRVDYVLMAYRDGESIVPENLSELPEKTQQHLTRLAAQRAEDMRRFSKMDGKGIGVLDKDVLVLPDESSGNSLEQWVQSIARGLQAEK
jgi:hypothetical protein